MPRSTTIPTPKYWYGQRTRHRRRTKRAHDTQRGHGTQRARGTQRAHGTQLSRGLKGLVLDAGGGEWLASSKHIFRAGIP